MNALLSLLLVFACACSPAGPPGSVAAFPYSPDVETDPARVAVDRSLALIQSSQAHWTEEIQCFSCHHQGVGSWAISLGREAGFDVDEELADSEAEAVREASRKRYRALLVNDGVGVFGRATTLLALAAHGRPRDDVTDVVASFLAARQASNGSWYSNEHRPPFEDSHVTATALTLRALDLYGPEGRSAEMRRRIERATLWLRGVDPRDTEERAMRLLGLAWGGVPAGELVRDARELLARQRADGGWAQLPTLDSDAYATGQALVVLHQLGAVAPGNRSWRRGVAFLLREQREDGSWFVSTRRRIRGLKPVDSGFPYSKHQFVSFLGSVWATMALTLDASSLTRTETFFSGARGRAPSDRTAEEHGLTALHRAAAFGSIDELRCELGRTRDPDPHQPGGVTPLMLAVHDPVRVDLLLQHGADPHAESKLGFTPLLQASLVSGSEDVVARLLGCGASVDARGANGASVGVGVASIGELGSLERLMAAGAVFPDTYLQQAFVYSATCNDVATGRALVELGADVNHSAARHRTPLTSAAVAGYEAFLEFLLAQGADPDVVDERGMTALAWAAKVDPGHSRIVARLLAAGADPARAADNGWIPADWAREYGNTHHLELLQPGQQ